MDWAKSMTPEGRRQVRAFRKIYTGFRKAKKARWSFDDMAEAIYLTRDEAFEKADPALMRRWEREFGHKRKTKIMVA